jgi:asparaginyl-tRNA synthetase
MDLLAPRIGEIIGGSQRELELRRRIAESNLDEKAYWWYLELRKFGTVPHAGFGLGFERLILYLTGMQNIRDVVPFPRTPGSAAF